MAGQPGSSEPPVKVTLTGGKRLEAALQRISKQVSKASTVQVGFPEGARYPDGTSLPMVAAIQEYGAPRAGIPPRPYFRNMIAKHSDEWPEQLGAELKAQDWDGAAALGSVGELIKSELQDSIRDTVAPPLSPVTIMLRSMRRADPSLVVNKTVVEEARARVARGDQPLAGTSEKPLVDSGFMIDNVKSTVK
jgi:hypothetical protein